MVLDPEPRPIGCDSSVLVAVPRRAATPDAIGELSLDALVETRLDLRPDGDRSPAGNQVVDIATQIPCLGLEEVNDRPAAGIGVR